MSKHTPESILGAADAETGPYCCDEEYQRLRAIMVAAPDLLEACEDFRNVLRSKIRDGKYREEYAEAFYQAERRMDRAIARAKGESS